MRDSLSVPTPLSSAISTDKDPLTTKLENIENQFTNWTSNVETLQNIITEFTVQYKEALAESDISMIPCYNYLLGGNELGNYLSLDLGGSTLRVSVITLDGANSTAKVVVSKNFGIPDSKKTINFAFFDWIAHNINEVISGNCSAFADSEEIMAGVTWSFPIFQTSSSDGTINKCGKGYNLDPRIFKMSIKSLFENSCSKYKIKLKILSLINDTVSVYLTAKFLDSSTSMGLVLGTGTNCCLFLPTNYINQNKADLNKDVLAGNNYHNLCLFNTEVSFFGEHVKSNVTKYDQQIFDWHSLEHAHLSNNFEGLFQPLEFLTSGRYISELCRLMVVDLIQQGLILKSQSPGDGLFQKYDFFTGEFCSNFYNLQDNKGCAEYFQQNFQAQCSDRDVAAIKKIIDMVIDRAAAILACSVVSLESLVELDNGSKIRSIGYDGSVLNNFHHYRSRFEHYLSILNPQMEYRLDFMNDSSILGAAIAAAANNNSVG
ncbi:hexokinase [Saccharomycopsis crataegensis]|uniref:Phosphotransferase n=1 Tax=Saccharomycopsis crataegensis TaxID=43959 RepID=A0AAV5QDI9_9ASCO|nr:hexokinase [Saccharomycopsis crataegensis]